MTRAVGHEVLRYAASEATETAGKEVGCVWVEGEWGWGALSNLLRI